MRNETDPHVTLTIKSIETIPFNLFQYLVLDMEIFDFKNISAT